MRAITLVLSVALGCATPSAPVAEREPRLVLPGKREPAPEPQLRRYASITNEDVCEFELRDRTVTRVRRLPLKVYDQIRAGEVRDEFKSLLDDDGIHDCAELGCWEAHVEEVDDELCSSPCGKQICVPATADGGLPEHYESIKVMRSALLNPSPEYCFAALHRVDTQCRLSLGQKWLDGERTSLGHGKWQLACGESQSACGRVFTCTCAP